MEYVKLGNSGLRVSKIILGCMSFGSPTWRSWVSGEEASLPILKAAYDAGINTWDTANFYSWGQSEEIIAKAMKTYNIPRHHVVLMTKGYTGVSENVDAPKFLPAFERDKSMAYANTSGLSRVALFHQVEESLRRLETTYIDVYFIHRCDKTVPKEETMKALHDLVQLGKIRYIAASSMWTWEFVTYQHVAELHGWTKFIAMQNCYSVLYREQENEMIPFCKDTGVGLTPYFALNSGRLTRPLAQVSDTAREDAQAGYVEPLLESDKEIIKRVEQLATQKGLSMAQVAFLWTAQRVDAPILGIQKVERIAEFVEALRHQLTDQDDMYLSELYEPHKSNSNIY